MVESGEDVETVDKMVDNKKKYPKDKYTRGTLLPTGMMNAYSVFR